MTWFFGRLGFASFALSLLACDDAAFVSPRERRPLAVVDGRAITLVDLERRVAALPEQQRPKDQAALRRLLDELVDTAVLEAEVRRRGFEKAPEAGAAVTAALAELELAELIGHIPGIDAIPRADVEQYYREHAAEFTTPEFRRLSVASFSSRAEAAAARTRPLEGAEDLGNVAALQGGRPAHAVPTPFVEALFGLGGVGAVSEPIEHEARFWLVAFTGRIAPQVRTLENEDGNIRRTLLQRRFEASRAAFLAQRRHSTAIGIDEAALGEVEVKGDPDAYDPAQWKRGPRALP